MDYFVSPQFLDQLSLFALIVGVPYIVLQYRAHPYFWHVSMLNALPMMYVYLLSGNYASLLLTSYYFLAALYVVVWGDKSQDSAHTFYIRRTPSRLILPLIALAVLLSVGIYFTVEACKPWIAPEFRPLNATAQALDAMATALSLVSMWMLARQYFENWFGWIVVNLLYVSLFLLQANYWQAAQFAIFFLVACLGVPKWRKLLRQQEEHRALDILQASCPTPSAPEDEDTPTSTPTPTPTDTPTSSR